MPSYPDRREKRAIKWVPDCLCWWMVHGPTEFSVLNITGLAFIAQFCLFALCFWTMIINVLVLLLTREIVCAVMHMLRWSAVTIVSPSVEDHLYWHCQYCVQYLCHWSYGVIARCQRLYSRGTLFSWLIALVIENFWTAICLHFYLIRQLH